MKIRHLVPAIIRRLTTSKPNASQHYFGVLSEIDNAMTLIDAEAAKRSNAAAHFFTMLSDIDSSISMIEWEIEKLTRARQQSVDGGAAFFAGQAAYRIEFLRSKSDEFKRARADALREATRGAEVFIKYLVQKTLSTEASHV